MAGKTESEIFKIADDIYAKTLKSPTNENILEARGKGSLSTIAPILKRWKEYRLNASIIPPSIRAVVEQFASSFWQAAETEFKDRQSGQLQEYLAIKNEHQNLQDAFRGMELSLKKLTELLQVSDNKNISLQEDLEFERSMHNRLKGEHKGQELLVEQLKNELEEKKQMINALLEKLSNNGATV